jgi:uncharacterized caspase-like protein
MNLRHGLVRAVAAAALAAAACSPACADTRVALVIGNGAYQNANRLANPANDASDVAQMLRQVGFDVIDGRDLDQRAMVEKIRDFGRKLERADVALFFYAGHGLQVAGRNYLVPIDAKLERPGDLNFETIDLAQVQAQMAAENRVNLIFLDACRDNPLGRTAGLEQPKGLAPIQNSVGTLTAFATKPYHVAYDGTGRNSPFTTALLHNIETPGVEVTFMFRYVRDDVMETTPATSSSRSSTARSRAGRSILRASHRPPSRPPQNRRMLHRQSRRRLRLSRQSSIPRWSAPGRSWCRAIAGCRAGSGASWVTAPMRSTPRDGARRRRMKARSPP